MKHNADLFIVCPGNNKIIYQELSTEYSAIEPPIWGALLAKYAKINGLSVALLDQEAEGLDASEVARRAIDAKPRLVAVVVYGQQPSASTQNMTMARDICVNLKEGAPGLKIIMIGGHPSALPERTLEENPIDFVAYGEGLHTTAALLQLSDLNDSSRYVKVPGLWYRQDGKPVLSREDEVIPQEKLPVELPGMAWEMLPMGQYRAHNWHCFTHINDRKPYASIYTSLGCPFKCTFCCINAPFGKPSIRYWDPKFVITELETLATQYNVKNIKIADEMFVLNERHVLDLCDLIIERGFKFNFWAYARVDTVKDKFLEKLQKAGFNWLCLGIESGSKHVRDGVQKGRFSQDDIYAIVKKIKDAGIYVLGNYMFGLPDDNYQSMRDTLNMSIELNCEMANFYSGMAYPGSQLYHMAIQKGWKLPEQWHDFSQHSFEQLPLPTEYLSAGEVLGFRDWSWQVYFTNPRYLNLVKEKFGTQAVEHIKKMTSFKLKRKYAVSPDKMPAEATRGFAAVA